jgi:uncharacterized MAPEG superfamily protein
MSRELFWLTLTVAMTLLFWVPYMLDRVNTRGLLGAMDNPGPNDPPQSPWAERQMGAHTNAVEGLVTFIPLVLTAHVLGISTGVTAGACMIYFWARFVHYIVYTLGIPVARTLAFGVGWLAQAALVLAIFKMI